MSLTISAVKSIPLNYVIAAPGASTFSGYTGSLPPGLSLGVVAGGVLLSGNPGYGGNVQYAGNNSYTFIVLWSQGEPNTVTVNVTDPSVLAVPVITCPGATPTTDGGTLSVSAGAFTMQFQASNMGTNWVYVFPTGVTPGSYSQSSSSMMPISGTLVPGSYTLYVNASNASYSGGPTQVASYALALNVTPAIPVITAPASGSLSTYSGHVISAQFSVQTYAGAVVWSATGLPDGCTINAATGLVSGIPAVAENCSATITATNSAGVGTLVAVFTISAPIPAPVIYCTDAPDSLNAGSITIAAGNIGLQFYANNGAEWSAALPAGISIDASSGVVSGQLSPGIYSGSVSCTNTPYPGGATQTGRYVLHLTVTPEMPVISLADSNSLNVVSGAACSAQFSVQANAGTVAWSATGLPYGCTLNATTGLVAGSPVAPGTFSAIITATNSTGSGTFAANFVVSASSTSTGAIAYPFLADDPSLTGVQIETKTGGVTLSGRTSFKIGMSARFAIVFLKNGTPVDPSVLSSVKMGVLSDGEIGSDYLLGPVSLDSSNLVVAVGNNPPYLLATIVLSDDALSTEMRKLIDAGSTDVLKTMSDIIWKTADGTPQASGTFNFSVEAAVTSY